MLCSSVQVSSYPTSLLNYLLADACQALKAGICELAPLVTDHDVGAD